MNKLHVLVVPTWYPNGIDKLMGRYHIDFCQALNNDKRMKANMIYIDRQGLSRVPQYIKMKRSKVETKGTIKVHIRKMLDIARISFDLQIKLYTKALLKEYKNYEKEHGKPDVIHAHVAVPAGYACTVLGKKIGVPVIITEHATYYDKFFEGKTEKYCMEALKNGAITCVGDFMIELYKKKGFKAKVLPNIVDCKNFDIKKNPRTKDRFNIVSISAMRDIKRLDNIMSAVKNLKNDIPNIHYTVIGDGDYEQAYKSHCKDIGMNEYVSFVGRKNHNEIAEILKDMDSLVVSSDFETFGIPAVEALAAGIPVVSTKNFGTEMFLNKDCSIFCEVNDITDLTRAIKEMYDKLESFDCEKLKEIAKQFDSQKVAELSYEYYKKLLK